MIQIGHYLLGNQLGAGGMGTVYLGTDTRTDTTVAIKELKIEIATPETIERFRREGEALRDLNHPNIVKMLDMFEHDKKHYLVMEYISGGDLSDLIKQGVIPVEKCVDMAIDLADALTRAHRLDIIHRDLKPANVLIGDDGILRLTDFGVARVGSKDRVTDTDVIVGTIDYLPPEAFDGMFDARGDIWAFGVMLFEMLSGQRPFSGSTIFETLQAITMAPIPDLETLCPSAPVPLVDLVYRMLERDLQARIPSVRRIGSEIEDIQHGRESINTPQPARFEIDIPDFTLLPEHNLPAQATPFVGREHELDELERLVKDTDIRLITIVAQGGMGKTRLSLELAHRVVDANVFSDGVYFVELAPLSDASAIPEVIVDAVGITMIGDGKPVDRLIHALNNKQILLVLDNYEHLGDGFGIVGDLLKGCPDLSVLVTSRQRLSQDGETVYPLSGMEFPTLENVDDAMIFNSVKLFVSSAKRANPAFTLTDANLLDIAMICRLVDGMPLGIVLSAGWVSLLSTLEIVEEIQNSLDFLETDERHLPQRQRSIRAVMNHAWDEMNSVEQNVFMKLSLFRGGFTRDSAQAVAGANIRLLMSLVNKSLIRRNAESGRYKIHELLRQFAGEHLESAELSDETRYKHLAYFAQFMQIRTEDVKGANQSKVRDDYLADSENFRLAWQYACKNDYYNYLDDMVNCFAIVSDIPGTTFLTEAFDMVHKNKIPLSEPMNREAQVHILAWHLFFAGRSHKYSYNPEQKSYIWDYLESCLQHAIETNDLLAQLLCYVAQADAIYNPLSLPQEFLIALDLSHRLNDSYYQCLVLRSICEHFSMYDRTLSDEHVKYVRQYLAVAQVTQNPYVLATAVWMLGTCENKHGSMLRCVELYHQSSILLQQANIPSFYYMVLGVYSISLFSIGNIQVAKSEIIRSIEYLKINQQIEPIFTAILGLINLIEGQVDTALDMVQSVVSIPTEDKDKARVDSIMALCLLVDGRYDKVRLWLKHALEPSIQLVGVRTTIDTLIPVVFYYEHDGNLKQAVQLLAIIETEPLSAIEWANNWDTFTSLKTNLKSRLGEQAYNDAWERGKSLDLETVVQDLIDEFSDS